MVGRCRHPHSQFQWLATSQGMHETSRGQPSGLIIRLQRVSVALRLNTTSAGVYKTRPLMDGALRSRARYTPDSFDGRRHASNPVPVRRLSVLALGASFRLHLTVLPLPPRLKPPAPSALTDGLPPSTQESCSSHTSVRAGTPSPPHCLLVMPLSPSY